MGNNIEKRKHPRIEVSWPIKIYLDNEVIDGEVSNISVEGIYISCEKPLRLSNTFRISVAPPHHQTIGVTGKVVWSDLYGLDKEERVHGVGICLMEIADKDRHFLNNLISDSITL